MADLAGSYDEQAEPGSFERLPAGTYRATIEESDWADISDKSDMGRCLKLTWKLQTGQFDGRLIWQRINLQAGGNMSNADKVKEIANQQLAAIRQATGKAAPKDSAELHGIPCLITIGPGKKNPEYDEVKSVRAAGSGDTKPQQRSSSAGQSSLTPQRSSSSTGGGGGGASKPWERRANA